MKSGLAQAIYLLQWSASDIHNPACLLRDHHFAAAKRVLACIDSNRLYHDPAASTSQARSQEQVVAARVTIETASGGSAVHGGREH